MGKQATKFYNFKAQTSNSPAELYIYGDISSSQSWWGDEISPMSFKKELDALGDVSQINVHINSDGGDVFAGQAIHSMLKNHKAKINVYVDGLAASIASVIAMAGDVIYMPANTMMMIHNPWTRVTGNSADLRKMATDLDTIAETIIAAYQSKSSIDRDKLMQLLTDETWLTAAQAVELGFADVIENEKMIAASVNKEGLLVLNGQSLNISNYAKAPKLAFIANNSIEDKTNQKDGSDNNMVFDITKLSAEAQAHITGLDTQINALTAKIKELESATQASTAVDIYAGWPQAAIDADKANKETIANSQAALDKIAVDNKKKDFLAKASALKFIPGKSTTELADLMFNLSAKAPDEYTEIEAMLNIANKSIETGTLLDEVGTSTGTDAVATTKDQVWAAMETKTNALLAASNGTYKNYNEAFAAFMNTPDGIEMNKKYESFK